MVRTYESDLKKRYRAWLDDNGCFWSNVTGGPYSKPGDPDTIACVDGLFVAIEAKTPGKNMTEEQELRRIQIERAGGMHLLAYTLQDVIDLVRNIRAENKEKELMYYESYND